jgi:hypothetical protein
MTEGFALGAGWLLYAAMLAVLVTFLLHPRR